MSLRQTHAYRRSDRSEALRLAAWRPACVATLPAATPALGLFAKHGIDASFPGAPSSNRDHRGSDS